MQDWTIEDIMGGRRSETDRPRPPSPLDPVDEQATAADGELPSWAAQAMADSGISTQHMDRAEVIRVAQQVQADDRFRDLLRGAIAAVEAAPPRSPTVTQPGTAAPATTGDAATADLGEGMIRWAAEADRGGVKQEIGEIDRREKGRVERSEDHRNDQEAEHHGKHSHVARPDAVHEPA